MKIKILGTRGNVEASAAKHTSHTGILIDNKILIDLGEESFLDEKHQYLFFTHLHPDHAYFEYSGKTFKQKHSGFIYAPEPHKKVKDLIVIYENEVVKADDYKITALPVIHSLKVKSLGYIVEHDGKRIFFSGDIAWIEKKYRERLGKLDMVITEGSYSRRGGLIRKDKTSGKIFGHTGLPDLVKLFKQFTRHILIVHLGAWFLTDPKKGIEVIRNFSEGDLKVEPAYDGQILEL